MSKGLASFAAGFGTGYINQMRYKDELDRKKKLEDIQLQQAQLGLDKSKKENAQDDAVTAGMTDAANMRVGQAVGTDGQPVDISAPAIEDKLDGGNLSPDVQKQVAEAYTQGVTRKDVDQWAKAETGADALKTTSKADIVRTQGAALLKGGSRYTAQAMALNDKANELDIKSLQNGILKAQSIDDINKNAYDLFPDGNKLGGEVGADGKFYAWTTDANGNHNNVRKYDNFDQFKDYISQYVTDNPDQILQAHKDLHAQQRETVKDDRDDKVAGLTIQQLQQKIKSGDIELANLPEETQLKLKALKANINQSNAAAFASTEGVKLKRDELAANGGLDKLPGDAKMMRYLVSTGVAKDQTEAFNMMNKNTDEGLVIKSAMEALNKDPDADPAQAIKNARAVVGGVRNPPATPPANRPPLSSFNQ